MPTDSAIDNETGLLAGLKVLDLSQFIPGPYCALMLSDLGADVLKIEPPAGDPMRALGPMDEDGLSPLYKVVNRGKRVLRIDLKSDDGRAVLEALLGDADALVESYRPGVLERLGFGAEVLSRRYPNLVHCALSGYGQTGPLSQAAGHDINYMALGGGLAASGAPETPVPAYPPTADYASSIQAAFAIVAALLRRSRTGRGASLDVSLMESVLGWQQIGLTAAMRGPESPLYAWMADRGVGLLNGGAAYYGIYATADGRHVSLGAIETKFWRSFCEAVDRPDLIPRQSEPLPQTTLAAEIRDMFASRTLGEWEQILNHVDCCFMPVEPLGTVPSHPHIQARGLTSVEPGPQGLVSVSCPVLVDGAAPPSSPSVLEVSADSALDAWTGR